MIAKLILYNDDANIKPIELLGYAELIDSDNEAYKKGMNFIKQKFIFENSNNLREVNGKNK